MRLENRAMLDGQLMKTVTGVIIRVHGGSGSNSTKTVLNTLEPTKNKIRETLQEGITVRPKCLQ